MLVLSRKCGEKIVIGDDIVVTVLRIGQKKIQLSIEAPSDVYIRRSELPPKEEERDDRIRH